MTLLYIITIIIGVALSSTSTTDTSDTWNKPSHRYAREWKFSSDDAFYRKGRVATLPVDTTTKVIETTIGARSSSVDPATKYKFTTIFPSNTTMFTKIVTLNTESDVQKLSGVSGMTTPRLIARSSTRSPTTRKSLVVTTSNKVLSSNVSEITTVKSEMGDDVTTRDNSKTHSYYHPQLKEKPKIPIVANVSQVSPTIIFFCL